MLEPKDITTTLFCKYYKIHDRERGKWYYDEWFILCLLKWAFDVYGWDKERWL